MATDTLDAADQLPDLGPYKALRCLGAGGMGQIFLAETAEGEKVAVKLLNKEMIEQPGAAVRFTQLGAMAMKLKHPNVVTVIDCGTLDNGQPYWVMEYLDGKDLGEFLSEKGTIDYNRMLEIARPVCSALNAAHQAGLVHLDIKPSNIFLSRKGDQEVVKLIDFGIAALAGKGESGGADSILGAPEYWSPEQASAREVDGRSDLYSFGVVLYEALTGNLPFRSHTFSDLVEHHLYSEPPPMSQVSASPVPIPRPVKNVVLKCLAKDRTRRYQDALELERALTDAVRLADEEENEPALQIVGETPSGELVVEPAPAPQARRRSTAAQVARAAASFVGGFIVIVAISSMFRSSPTAIAFAFAPSTVPVLISSEPAGALVYLEGARQPQGKTPLVVHFPRSQEAVGVVVHFSGDAEMRTLVTPSHPSEVFVKMKNGR